MKTFNTELMPGPRAHANASCVSRGKESDPQPRNLSLDGARGNFIRVAVVSEYTLAATGIVMLLRDEPKLRPLGAFPVEACCKPLSRLEPDVVVALFDRAGPGLERFVRTFRLALPLTKIVFVSLADDELGLLLALRWGVEGAVDLKADGAFLAHCIREVVEGEIVIGEKAARELVRQQSARNGAASTSRLGHLTDREAGILRLVARGESNKGIAGQLSISENTVKAHLRSIMRKLEVANRVQAAVVALQSGLATS